MAVFTSAYKALAHGALNWDTQLRADMQTLEDILGQGGWYPGYGGTGANLGNGGTTNGYWTRLGQHIQYNGRLAFGSSCSWGTGTPAVLNLNVVGGIDPTTTTGSGLWTRAASGQVIPIVLRPIDTFSMSILVAQSATSTYPWNIAAVGQSDTVVFTIQGTWA